MDSQDIQDKELNIFRREKNTFTSRYTTLIMAGTAENTKNTDYGTIPLTGISPTNSPDSKIH